VHAARGRLVATLDGDGQNDPADIPRLLARHAAEGGGDALLVAGHRTNRRDTAVTRLSSRIANSVRGALLRDHTPDTGCGLKLFPRDLFLRLPYFDHMHRFLPALVIRAGGRVVSEPVGHRARTRGRSHYGVWNRLWVGIVDLLGVLWLIRRARTPEAREVPPQPSSPMPGKR
jgi:dolichol-phosphate mannosyltransferase